jgi:hypothetical protein
MNQGDRLRLRQAAGEVESAESSVLGMIGLDRESKSGEELAQDEIAALREISSNLRAACTRMWSMAEQSG